MNHVPMIHLRGGLRVTPSEMRLLDLQVAGVRPHIIAKRLRLARSSISTYVCRAYRRNGLDGAMFYRAYAADYNVRVLKLSA